MNTNASKFECKEDFEDWTVEVDTDDAPEYSDARISYATCSKTGRELTQEELEALPSYLVDELVRDSLS